MTKKICAASITFLMCVFSYNVHTAEELLQDIKQQMNAISDRLQTIESAESIKNKLDQVITIINEIKTALPSETQLTSIPVSPDPTETITTAQTEPELPTQIPAFPSEEAPQENISDLAQQTPVGPPLEDITFIEQTTEQAAPTESLLPPMEIPTLEDTMANEATPPAKENNVATPEEAMQTPTNESQEPANNNISSMTVDETITDLPSEAPSIAQVLTIGKIDENKEVELKNFLQNKEKSFEEKFPGPEFLALTSDLNLLFAYAQAISKYKELFDEAVKKNDKEAATRLQIRVEETKQKYGTTVKNINSRYKTVEWYGFYTKQ